MFKNKVSVLFALIVLVFVFALSISTSGCCPPTAPQKGEKESKKETTQTAEEKPKTLSLGQSAEGDTWQYTVKDFRIVDEINEQNNPYLIKKAGEGMQYLIITFDIKNITNETQQLSWASVIGFDLKIHTEDDKILKPDQNFDVQTALAKPLISEDVAPGATVSGDVAFKITRGASIKTLEIAAEQDMVWELKK